MAKTPKKRIDQLLVDRGLVESKSKAQALIMAGLVHGVDKKFVKPGQQLAEDTEIHVKGKDHPWVSRGGLKLVKGLDHFQISAAGRTCLDLGCSTGGFTDVLLSHGAAKVYAVDVGHGQFAWKLRNDDRVVLLEKTNARHLTRDLIPETVELIVCDVSFIGLELVLPPAMALAGPNAHLVSLIKPQFQVGKGQVGKGGVVRDSALHQKVCSEIEQLVGGVLGWRVLGITESPITGPEGNKEFLIGAEKGG